MTTENAINIGLYYSNLIKSTLILMCYHKVLASKLNYIDWMCNALQIVICEQGIEKK